MKRFVLYSALFVAVLFTLCVTCPAGATHQDQPTTFSEKKLFTKHFQDTIFDISEHAEFSVEVLLDDKEYNKLGKNVVGIVVHNAHDEDVADANINIGMKSLDGNETAPPYNVTDKGGGLYTVSGLDLKRPGKWELTVLVKKNGIEDRVRFILPDAIKNRVPKGRYSP